MIIPTTITSRHARRTIAADPVRRRCAEPRAMPMIGVDRGAMIIAPITVAVESVSTPPPAMTDDIVSMVQKAEHLDVVSPDDGSRSWVSSSSERRWEAGRARARTLLITPPNNHGQCRFGGQDADWCPSAAGPGPVEDPALGPRRRGQPADWSRSVEKSTSCSLSFSDPSTGDSKHAKVPAPPRPRSSGPRIFRGAVLDESDRRPVAPCDRRWPRVPRCVVGVAPSATPFRPTRGRQVLHRPGATATAHRDRVTAVCVRPPGVTGPPTRRCGGASHGPTATAQAMLLTPPEQRAEAGGEGDRRWVG